jgi:hypothetical protein
MRSSNTDSWGAMDTIEESLFTLSIQLILIEGIEFHFFFDRNNQPVIQAEGRSYRLPANLLDDFPVLKEGYTVVKTAQLINFLMTGVEFRLIENPEKFREDYLQQIESERSGFDTGHLARISDYGIFDVSRVRNPIINEDNLVFFVKNESNNLPYKVSLEFPLTNPIPKATYTLLPFFGDP